MRNEEAIAADRRKLESWTLTRPSSQPRTCEPPNIFRAVPCPFAFPEVHALHSLGEHDLVDSTCGWEGEKKGKDKVRNEEACAAGRQNVLNKYDINHP